MSVFPEDLEELKALAVARKASVTVTPNRAMPAATAGERMREDMRQQIGEAVSRAMVLGRPVTELVDTLFAMWEAALHPVAAQEEGEDNR